MGIGFYYFAVRTFLAGVFAAAVYISLKGNALARYFLWTWALLLVIAVPFVSLIPESARTYVGGLAILFFLYTIFIVGIRSQNKIDMAQDEMRRVLAESNNRMDEERRRIARQLHDEINPTLVLAKLELQKLVPIIDRNIADENEAEKANRIIGQLLDSISAVYQDSRQIIKNTRIEIIDSIGLVAAVESLVTHYKGILENQKVTLQHNFPRRPDIPSAIAVNAYRIIQEALLNAVKHADASNIAIDIRQSGKRISVCITDDGIGIGTKNSLGIGLIDMRERARVLGGELQVTNKNGKGTKITFSFSRSDSSIQI